MDLIACVGLLNIPNSMEIELRIAFLAQHDDLTHVSNQSNSTTTIVIMRNKAKDYLQI